ncbi:hypothetical protein ACPWUF_08755 [Bisgaard Taxon 46]
MLYRGQILFNLLFSLFLSSLLILVMVAFYVQIQQQNKTMSGTLALQSELQSIIQLIEKDVRRAGFRAVSEKVIQHNFSLFEQENGRSVAMFSMQDNQKDDCLLFFYDLDRNGCLGGAFKGKQCVQNGHNQTQYIERELFGYRLNQGMIETRLMYKSAVNPRCVLTECQKYLQKEACRYGGWVDLLDAQKYRITHLSFQWLAERKGIAVSLMGELKQQPEITYETSAVIPLLNQE